MQHMNHEGPQSRWIHLALLPLLSLLGLLGCTTVPVMERVTGDFTLTYDDVTLSSPMTLVVPPGQLVAGKQKPVTGYSVADVTIHAKTDEETTDYWALLIFQCTATGIKKMGLFRYVGIAWEQDLRAKPVLRRPTDEELSWFTFTEVTHKDTTFRVPARIAIPEGKELVLGCYLVPRNADKVFREALGRALDEALVEIAGIPPSLVRLTGTVDIEYGEAPPYRTYEHLLYAAF